MPTRRTIFVAAAAVGVGGLIFSGKTDDIVRGFGVDPVPEVRERDQELVAQAIAENQTLLTATLVLNAEVARQILVQQIIDLGGAARETSDSPTTITRNELKKTIQATALRRQKDSVEAASPQLAQTLGSLAAGLAQPGRLKSEAL